MGLLGTGAQDGHLDFHTAPEFCTYNKLKLVEVLLYVHRNRRLIRDGHLDFHTAPEPCPLYGGLEVVISVGMCGSSGGGRGE